MGDPRKQRRKYSRPKHPWKIDRIEEENELSKAYGLKNKREIWKAKEMLRGYRQQARTLLAATDEEADKEKKELLKKLQIMGVLESEVIEDILSLSPQDILNRRLQTIVYRKGLATTPKQARQLVIHKHVKMNGRTINVPSYLVKKGEEDTITLNEAYAKKVAQ